MEEEVLRALAVRALAVRGVAARVYQERLAQPGPIAERSDPAEALAVLLRGLRPRERSALALSPGERLQIAFAIWNAAADGLAHNSVTLWHAIELAD